MSALRVGHCLLSDLAGDFEKLLTSGCLLLLLSDPAGDSKSLLTSWLSALRVVLPVFTMVLLKK